MKAKKQRRNGVAPHLLLVENETRAAKKEIVRKRDSWILKRQGSKITTKTGEIMFQCPVCEKFNKPLFFTNQHDLDLHLMRLHSGYPIQVKADNSPATETAPEIKPEMPAEFSDEKVVSVRDLDPPSDQRKCARCHKPKTLQKQAEYSDGAWAPICEDCAEALSEKLRERTPSKVASGGMLRLLRDKFPEKFVDVEFSDFTVKQGWTKSEGESYLKMLEKDGAIFKIGEGWRWA